jgi:5'-nucleotidase
MNENKRPQILLTNDDSIDSPGLWAAAEALSDLGFVHVVAPRVQQTSMGRAMPRESDNLRHEKELEIKGQSWKVYSVGGSPAQSVLHGLLGVMKDVKPDLVVSGINYGENVASGITISGTVGAALEAASFGYPALAISLQTPVTEHFNLSNKVDFSTAAWFTNFFAEKLLRLKMPFDVDVLKVDVPASANPKTPWVVTRQSRQRYFEVWTYIDSETGVEKIGYKAEVNEETAENGSDLKTILVDNLVSVTPVSLDLTSRVDFGDLSSLLNS